MSANPFREPAPDERERIVRYLRRLATATLALGGVGARADVNRTLGSSVLELAHRIESGEHLR